MTKLDQARRDFEAICARNKFSVMEITGKSRLKNAVLNRKAVALELMDKGYDQMTVAAVLKVNRSTISYYKRKEASK